MIKTIHKFANLKNIGVTVHNSLLLFPGVGCHYSCFSRSRFQCLMWKFPPACSCSRHATQKMTDIIPSFQEFMLCNNMPGESLLGCSHRQLVAAVLRPGFLSL